MLSNGAAQAQVVFIFTKGRLVREMLFEDFETVLDGFVPLSDFASQTVRGIFARIDQRLHVTAAVFFSLGFDAEGFADKRWNLPLQQFADESAKGPDLGAGPIRLACASQCSISWHQKHLWDPQMDPGANDFVRLKKAALANRLKLPVAAPPTAAPALKAVAKSQTSPARPPHLTTQQFRDRTAQLIRSQRLRVRSQRGQLRQKLQALQVEHQARLEHYRKQVHRETRAREDADARNGQLQASVAVQAKKIEALREYFEYKLQAAQQGENSQLETLRENFSMELAAKVESATTALKSQLQVRDMELMYRGEQEHNYQDEIARLREENQTLVSNNGDRLLRKLSLSGISFVASHPGAGHFTIPIADMGAYLEQPQAFVADLCGVSLDQYRDWLEHYHAPECREPSGKGTCGVPIDRVPTAAEFHSGENDRCLGHRRCNLRSFGSADG